MSFTQPFWGYVMGNDKNISQDIHIYIYILTHPHTHTHTHTHAMLEDSICVRLKTGDGIPLTNFHILREKMMMNQWI